MMKPLMYLSATLLGSKLPPKTSRSLHPLYSSLSRNSGR